MVIASIRRANRYIKASMKRSIVGMGKYFWKLYWLPLKKLSRNWEKLFFKTEFSLKNLKIFSKPNVRLLQVKTVVTKTAKSISIRNHHNQKIYSHYRHPEKASQAVRLTSSSCSQASLSANISFPLGIRSRSDVAPGSHPNGVCFDSHATILVGAWEISFRFISMRSGTPVDDNERPANPT